jgi:alanine-synthesizing transaminase
MFSKIASQLRGESNALYTLRDTLKSQGHEILDLISGNINDQGFVFPQNLLEEILVQASRRSRLYRPDSFGQLQAREAICEYYARCGQDVSPESILVTPGTSLSYWYCFKLLADEGDEILCPCPSYPLFDYIALMSGVKLIPYRLQETQGWDLDLEHLEACVSTRTRAVILISPHNPTGHVSSSEEISALAELARRLDLAIISDEVFSEFLFGEQSLPRPMGCAAPLIFTLNGFSKMFALPGLKFGWMAVSGDPEKARHSMRALELMADTFLPVNEIVQTSAPEIFRRGKEICAGFARGIHDCWKTAENFLAQSRNCSYIKPGGGFYITLHIGDLDEEKVAETILLENHMLVHPGYFYDMDPNHLVLSFVQKPEAIRASYPRWLGTLENLERRNLL